MNITPYLQRLQKAVDSHSKIQIEEVCFDIEFTQLESMTWSNEVFEFFSNALQNPKICALNGSASLITSLYNDFCKLSESQKKMLLEIFEENSKNYDDEMLRHSVSDFLARKYPPKVAMKIFEVWHASNLPKEKHMAKVGFEVLVMTGVLSACMDQFARKYLSSSE